jgi:uncharacterized protein YbjT (DUF2867 family)
MGKVTKKRYLYIEERNNLFQFGNEIILCLINQDKIKSRTAIIVGATGLVGKHCLQLLLTDQYYSKVTVITPHSTEKHHSKMVEHIIGFERLNDYRSLVQGDHAFCCIDTIVKKPDSKENLRKVNYNYIINFAEICAFNNIPQFSLISWLQASGKSRIFSKKIKEETEEKITQLPFHGIQILRPALLTKRTVEKRLEKIITEIFLKGISPLLIGKLKNYKPIAADAVAKAMVEFAKIELKGINIFESNQMQFFISQLKKNKK